MYCYRKKKEKDRDREREDENEQKFNLDALRDLFQKAKELVIQVLQYYIMKHNEAFFKVCCLNSSQVKLCICFAGVISTHSRI